MAHRRIDRINDLMRAELSTLISRELKDPRVAGMVSVMRVETTTDLKQARVFISVYGTDEDQKSTLVALRSAMGFLRREVAHRVILRHTPELEFVLDKSLEQGDRILRLINQVAAESAPKPRRSRKVTAPEKAEEGEQTPANDVPAIVSASANK